MYLTVLFKTSNLGATVFISLFFLDSITRWLVLPQLKHAFIGGKE